MYKKVKFIKKNANINIKNINIFLCIKTIIFCNSLFIIPYFYIFIPFRSREMKFYGYPIWNEYFHLMISQTASSCYVEKYIKCI